MPGKKKFFIVCLMTFPSGSIGEETVEDIKGGFNCF